MPGQKLSFPGRNYLFAPGPTHIPNVVQNAMNVPMEDHRAPDFPELVKPILRDLKESIFNKNWYSFHLSCNRYSWMGNCISKHSFTR